MTRASFYKLVGALGIMAVLGQMSSSAPPTAGDDPDEIRIEQIRGIRRDEPWSNKKKDVAPANQNPPASQDKDISPKRLSGPPLPLLVMPLPDTTPAPTIIPYPLPEKPLGMPKAKGTAKPGPGNRQAKLDFPKEGTVSSPRGASEAQEVVVVRNPEPVNTVPVTVIPVTPVPLVPVSIPEVKNQDAASNAIWPRVGLAVVAILVPGALVLGFVWLRGRYRRQYAPLFREEKAEIVPVVTGPITAIVEVPEREAVSPTLERGRWLEEMKNDAGGLAQTQETEAEPFNPGLTYEQEQQAREVGAEQSEDAFLQHLVEENLRLQQQFEQARENEEK